MPVPPKTRQRATDDLQPSHREIVVQFERLATRLEERMEGGFATLRDRMAEDRAASDKSREVVRRELSELNARAAVLEDVRNAEIAARPKPLTKLQAAAAITGMLVAIAPLVAVMDALGRSIWTTLLGLAK